MTEKAALAARSGAQPVALVLSGGGAEGAYSVGVLKALVNGASGSTGHHPLQPKIFAGTSVGAYNAAFLVSHWSEYGTASVANLESVWLNQVAEDRHANGFFRLRIDPVELADPRSYLPNPFRPFLQAGRDGAILGWDSFQRLVHLATASDEPLYQRVLELANISSFISSEPFKELIRETIDFKALRSASQVLKIFATNWASGELRTFEGREMTESQGPPALLASAAIPGFTAPVEIGTQPLVDGGVLLNTPLKPAIDSGARTLHVVYLDPDVRNIPLAHIMNSASALYRMIQIQWAARVNDDIGDAAAINQGLEILAKVRRGETANFRESQNVLRRLAQILERSENGNPYRPLTIHRYHPRDSLTGSLGILNFQRDRIEKLIERGFQDAARHDCFDSGCVLPDMPLGETLPGETQ